MRKTYTLALFMVVALVQQTAAQYIQGPLSVCSGQTATYTVYGPSCMVQIDGPSGLDYGTYSHNPGTSSFSITWTNNTLSPVNDNFKIYISNMVYNPDGTSTGCPSYYEISMNVNVKPNITYVNTPNTPTVTYISGKLYEFSTYSSNALNFEWSITGGTIQGSATGNTIRVIRSSNCTLTARVRGYSTGCNGIVYSGYSTTTSYTVPPPPFSYINGTSYLYPNSTFAYTPFFTTTSSEQGAVTSWSLSDPGGKLTLSPMGNTAYISSGTPTSTLRYATLTCTVSNGCGTKTISKSLMYGGQSGYSSSISGGKVSDANGKKSDVQLYPNPSKAGDKINVEVGIESEIDSLVVLDATGAVVEEIANTSAEESSKSIDKLRPGTYYLRAMKRGEVVETTRFLVE